jgi:hypothetical protein
VEFPRQLEGSSCRGRMEEPSQVLFWERNWREGGGKGGERHTQDTCSTTAEDAHTPHTHVFAPHIRNALCNVPARRRASAR